MGFSIKIDKREMQRGPAVDKKSRQGKERKVPGRHTNLYRRLEDIVLVFVIRRRDINIVEGWLLFLRLLRLSIMLQGTVGVHFAAAAAARAAFEREWSRVGIAAQSLSRRRRLSLSFIRGRVTTITKTSSNNGFRSSPFWGVF